MTIRRVFPLTRIVDTYRAVKASDQTLTSGNGGGLGLSITIASISANDTWDVSAILDVQANAANAATFVGQLSVDGGSALATQIIIRQPTAGMRGTVAQSWTLTGLTPGSHTLSLAAFVTSDAGSSYQINASHSVLTASRRTGAAQGAIVA